MDINDLFDGIMKSINQFAFDPVERRLLSLVHYCMTSDKRTCACRRTAIQVDLCR